MQGGKLHLAGGTIHREIDPITWRFKLETNLHLKGNASLDIHLGNEATNALEVTLNASSVTITSEGKRSTVEIDEREPGTRSVHLVVEGDFSEKALNLYIDGKRVADFVPFSHRDVGLANRLYLAAKGDVEIDDIFLFNHDPAPDTPRQPIRSSIVLDETSSRTGHRRVAAPGYDDSHWKPPPRRHGASVSGRGSLPAARDRTGALRRATLE